VASGIVAPVSGTTRWRWLSHDGLRPWRHRTRIVRRDPQFARKAGRVRDRYQRRWRGAAPGPRADVLSPDEKTRIQARQRKHRSVPSAAGRPISVEHAYRRVGALADRGARDGHRAQLFGRGARPNGIASLERLIAQVMVVSPVMV